VHRIALGSDSRRLVGFSRGLTWNAVLVPALFITNEREGRVRCEIGVPRGLFQPGQAVPNVSPTGAQGRREPRPLTKDYATETPSTSRNRKAQSGDTCLADSRVW